VRGLKAAGVPEFDNSILMRFMESLQCEDEEEELLVDYPYFESLVEHCRSGMAIDLDSKDISASTPFDEKENNPTTGETPSGKKVDP
jgi:hypothetical protein